MIHFHNPQIGINTRFKNSHIYEQFTTIDKKWTPIEQKLQKYKLVVILAHIIAIIQFPIQLATTHTTY